MPAKIHGLHLPQRVRVMSTQGIRQLMNIVLARSRPKVSMEKRHGVLRVSNSCRPIGPRSEAQR